MYVIVVGGGKVGYHLASTLVAEQHEVLVIERDVTRYEGLRRLLGDDACFLGDGSELHTLEMAGAARADALVAVSGKDETNLVICQIAQRYFHVPRVVSRVNNPKNEEIFSKLGITATISSTRIIYSLVVQEVETAEVTPVALLKRGNLALVEIALEASSPAVGVRVRDLALPDECVLVGIVQGEDVLVPHGNTTLRKNDVVLALVRRGKEQVLEQVLRGPAENR